MWSFVLSILRCVRPFSTIEDCHSTGQESRENFGLSSDPCLAESEARLLIASLNRKSGICLMWMKECVEARDLLSTIDLAKKIAKARDISRELAEKYPALKETVFVLEAMNLKGIESVDEVRSLLLDKSIRKMLECRLQPIPKLLDSFGILREDTRKSIDSRKRSRSA